MCKRASENAMTVFSSTTSARCKGEVVPCSNSRRGLRQSWRRCLHRARHVSGVFVSVLRSRSLYALTGERRPAGGAFSGRPSCLALSRAARDRNCDEIFPCAPLSEHVSVQRTQGSCVIVFLASKLHGKEDAKKDPPSLESNTKGRGPSPRPFCVWRKENE